MRFKSYILIALFILAAAHINGQTMIINEIMFKPGPSLSGCDQKLVSEPAPTCGREYIELFNSDCYNDYDLSGYVLASASSTSPGLYNGGAICFPPGTIVPAGSFLIIGGANDHNPSTNGTYDYPANSFDFKIPSYLNTQYLCLNTANTYWFLANVDGWMALFEPNGNIHSAVYWTPTASDILTTAEFDLAPCLPAAYTGPALPSAKTIYQTNPTLIQYMGNPMSITQGLTFSRIPDGGNFQMNKPPTIGPLRSDRCNDGQCITCGNLVLTTAADTCGVGNGSISAQIVNQVSSPPPYIYSITGPVNIGPVTTSVNPYVINNLPSGTYIVSVTDNFSPPNITVDTIVVGVTGNLTVTASSTDASCNANDGSATVNVSGGNGNYSYSWNTTPSQTTQTVANLQQGQYTVTITSGGCSTSVIVIVNGVIGPTIISSSTPEHCGMSDGSIIVTASGGSGTYTYLWNNGQTTATITGIAAGSYSVTVGDGGNCSPTSTVVVAGISGPTALLEVDQLYAPPGSTINLTSLSNNNVNLWTWDFGNNNSVGTYVPNTSYVYDSPGSYTVWLIVTDNNGCSDSASAEVNIVAYEIPNIITPNKDGFNETFQIKGLEAIPGKTLLIYNRWGRLVYESENYMDDWDGNNCNDGIYFYVLKLPELQKEINGTITILK